MDKPDLLESTWTQIGDLRMHARRSRTLPTAQPPVVLVHGLVVSSRYMIPTAERLAPSHAVYAPDLPGFGKSDHPAKPLDVGGLAKALAGWMRAVGLAGASLIGNSFGCQVIAELALRHPELVGRIVLVGPTMDRHGRSLPEQVRRLLAAGPHDNPGLLRIQVRDVLAAGVRETVATTRFALEDRIEAKLPDIAAPALVVRGRKDPIAPERWCVELARLLPRGQLLTIPGGHALNYSYPERLIEAIGPFLRAEPLESALTARAVAANG